MHESQQTGYPDSFTLALLTSAVAAPAVGRWCDRGRGPYIMQAAGFTAAALLVAWVLMPTVLTLYVLWAALGPCMAAVLYEPAFMIIGRSYRDPTDRLRALALVTVFGGLASTVFLPVTTYLVAFSGWRVAVLALAAVLMCSTLVTRRAVFRDLSDLPPTAMSVGRDRSGEPSAPRSTLAAVSGMFALATFASSAFTANLIPALAERRIPAMAAAFLGGAMGAMQLPGRLLLMDGRLAASPRALLTISLLLHAAGLLVIVFSPPTPMTAIGALVFAIGAGLMTLVRPFLVQTVFSIERAGEFNGRIARQQQLARAAGPVVVALLASRFSYSWVLAALALSFVMVNLAVPALLGGTVSDQ